jgi:hypothetical protein
MVIIKLLQPSNRDPTAQHVSPNEAAPAGPSQESGPDPT